MAQHSPYKSLMQDAPTISTKICVLVNPHAGPATSNDLQSLQNDPSCVLRELKSDEDWNAVVADVVRSGCDMIVVAGGDGTVHGVFNAILRAKHQVKLGIIPLGTGNDFCRTLAIPFAPSEAIRLLRTGEERSIDTVKLGGDRDEFFVNAATGGFSGKVATETTSDVKAAWGPFAYLRGAVGPLTDLPRYRLTLRFNDAPPEKIDALNIVVANGRTAAGGVQVAPTANPEDGLLDVVIVRFGESLDLALLGSRLMHGNYIDDENVLHRRVKRIEFESDQPMPLSIDGELCEGRRFTFEIVPHALRIVVGPEYSPDSVPDAPIEDETALEAADVPKSTREGLFGLLTGLLLVVKRIGVELWILALLATSVWLARGVVSDRWQDLNADFYRSLRSHSTPLLDDFAGWVTWLGGWGVAFVVPPILFLFVRRKHYLSAGTLLVSVLGVLVIEVTLKPLFALPRPDTSHLTTYSFPSGHALRGVAIYGLLAAMAARRNRPGWWLVALLCAAIAAGIAMSRVYIGVHWLTDVIMGGLLAAAWASICLLARNRVERRRR